MSENNSQPPSEPQEPNILDEQLHRARAEKIKREALLKKSNPLESLREPFVPGR